ncbi:anti-sigma factor domain-containing protein [Moorella naiadis]|uniref:anti-sigma factor domain-containing protein n=1 Tax=Moorella naiadis (nom. illeg.) TaxID=3093670 RepID=UPI003D9C7EB9
MDGAERGLVMSRAGEQVVVLTPQGEWRTVKVAAPLPEVGEEVMLPPVTRRPIWPLVTAAAVILMLILASALVRQGQAPPPSAALPVVAYYVNVDINPSVEIAVDKGEIVINARGLNSDGEKLLAGINLQGEKVTRAMKLLALEALRQGYYLAGGSGAMVVTVVPAGSEKEKLAAGDALGQKLTREARDVFSQAKVQAVVEAATVQPEIRQHAQAAGLSAGKYSIMLEALAAGARIKATDLQRESITRVLQQINFDWDDVFTRLKKDPDLLKREELLGPALQAALGKGPFPEGNGAGAGNGAAPGPAIAGKNNAGTGRDQDQDKGKGARPPQAKDKEDPGPENRRLDSHEGNPGRGPGSRPASRDGLEMSRRLHKKLSRNSS